MPTLDLDNRSYYNDMGIDTLWTGDIARSLDISIDVRPPVDVEEIDARRRGFERYDLSANQIRVSIYNGPNRSPNFGVLTDASVTGMWVATSRPLPFREEVVVEWSVMGFSQNFDGRVVRCSDDGMAILLDTNDDTWRFRSSFIDLARTPSVDPPMVTVRQRGEHEKRAVGRDDGVDDELRAAWDAVVEDLEDDTVHQAFIHECIRVRRLQFGLECYRELKTRDPSSPQATKYLKQIGTILAFYTLQPNNTLADGQSKRSLFPFIVVAAVVIGALLLAPVLLRQKLDRPVAPPPQVSPTGFVQEKSITPFVPAPSAPQTGASAPR